MENPPFEDVFPIQDGDFPLLCLFTGGYIYIHIDLVPFSPALITLSCAQKNGPGGKLRSKSLTLIRFSLCLKLGTL